MAKLPLKQSQAIEALLTSDSIREASSKVGVSETSLHKWLKNEQFQAEYKATKKAIVEQAVSSLTSISSLAVNQVHDLLLNSRSDHVRLSACKLVLDFCLQKVELEELTTKLEAIEERGVYK
jgi:transposase-like protein